MVKKIAVVVGVLVVGFLVVYLIPLKTVPYTVQDTEPLSYEIVSDRFVTTEMSGDPWGSELSILSWRGDAYLTIKNTDDVSGTFTIQLGFEERSLKLSQSIYLEPGEQGTVRFQDIDKMDKPKLDAVLGTKQRPETRYKKITLLDYWLYYSEE
jgi:hypothetical protein